MLLQELRLIIKKFEQYKFRKEKVMSQYKILLVDDDKDILEINRAFLESEGYEVVTATTIAQTMEKIQIHNFRVLPILIRILLS